MNTSPRERLFELLQERSFIQREVVLSSGEQSDYYIDGKMVEVCPEGAYLIGEVLYDQIKHLNFNAVGGLAVGAVPLVTSVAISCHRHGRQDVEGFWVREEAKSHGTQKVIEGRLPDNARAVIVDDVVTSGKSVLKAIQVAEERGVEIVLALAIVDRQRGARELLAQRGCPYESIFSKEDFFAHANA